MLKLLRYADIGAYRVKELLMRRPSEEKEKEGIRFGAHPNVI